MNSKTSLYILSFFILNAFFIFDFVEAATECDLQAKPALSCPTGYSVMCIPTGGYHWGCGKESGGAIIETSSSGSSDTGSAIFQNKESDIDFIQKAAGTAIESGLREDAAVSTKEACYAKCRDQYGGSGSAGYDACIRSCGAGGVLKTDPAVKPEVPITHTDGDPDRPVIEGRVPNKESMPEIMPARLAPVLLKAVEVRGWDPKKKEEFLLSVKEHAELKSGQDLENFARGVLVKDENVEDVIIEEERVRISYRQPAKFLRIFNSSLVMRAEADKEGKVKVKYPWYKFLFKRFVNDAEVQTEAEKGTSGVKQTMQTQVKEGSSDEEVEMLKLQEMLNRQSRFLQTLSNIMKAQHDTAMSVIRNMK